MSSNNDAIQKTAQSGTSSNGTAITQTAQSQSTFRDSSEHKRSVNEGLSNRRLNYTHENNKD